MREIQEIKQVQIEIPKQTLESVFEECDRHDRDETGGRVIGHFAKEGSKLLVRVRGVIEPGPNAKRTSTSFFQDGNYQTNVFRKLESKDPSIEHLGNWHTHHVNGYPTLSSGDISTYQRIVNHEFHNLNFFYALLVTNRNKRREGLERYNVRHFFLFRGDGGVYEVGNSRVVLTDDSSIWPEYSSTSRDRSQSERVQKNLSAVRAHDQQVLGVMFPSMKPRLSTGSGTFFWKGPLTLVDGSEVPLRVLEVEAGDRLEYYARLVAVSSNKASELCRTPFNSASEAVRTLELTLNQEIYALATTKEA